MNDDATEAEIKKGTVISLGETSQILPKIVSRTKLSSEVVVPLRQAILSGQYASGEHLRLEALARQLGTSIMPVREALIILAGEGLVAVLPRRGFVVTPPDDQDWEDLFELQSHLAGILTRRAVAAATDADVDQLKKIQAKIVDQTNKPSSESQVQEINRLNLAFHRHINRIPKGSRARWFLRVTTQFTQNPAAKTGPGWIEMMLRDHARIIAAFEARDAEFGARLMERHFADGSRLIATQFGAKTAAASQGAVAEPPRSLRAPNT